MLRHSRFVVRNDSPRPVTLSVEPEGAFFPLEAGSEVTVADTHTAAPVTLTLSGGGEGGPVLSIWPGDGEVRVEKDGVDVLELLQHGAGV